MRRILSLVTWVGLIWAIGLAWFVLTTPNESLPARLRSDAIVVLTGGKGRVEHGFRMLAENAAPLMFVSGVGKNVTLQEMVQAHTKPATRQKIYAANHAIILGHAASSTQTNAEEVAAFIRLRPLQSIRLVTSHYHMKRSLLEFRRTLPALEIHADPVISPEFLEEEWWRNPAARRLVLSEYHKYLAA